MSELPIEFIDRIKKQFPKEADELIRSLDNRVQPSIRINKGKKEAYFQGALAVPWNSEGYVLPERPRFTLDPKLHAGCYYPQESSSMVLQWVLKHCDFGAGHLDALDVCAAPGGKSLIIADFLAGRGRLVSNEIIRQRAHILQEVLVKWGSPHVAITNNSPSDFGRGAMSFDLILADAPCSGEGMFRKDPESRMEWSGQSAALCSMRQWEILCDVLPALKENGVLIYSTCTFAKEENEDMVMRLLDTGEFESIRWPVPESWNIDVIESRDLFAMRFLPHKVSGEGFFIAALRKKIPSKVSRVKPKTIFMEPSKSDLQVLSDNNISADGVCVGPDKEIYRSAFSCNELNKFAGSLYLLMPGVHLGRIVRNDFIPGHAFALAQGEKFQQSLIELDEHNATAYLRGETIALEAPSGWHRVAYQGAALGWLKVIGNRVNNYYPKEWRVKIRE